MSNAKKCRNAIVFGLVVVFAAFPVAGQVAPSGADSLRGVEKFAFDVSPIALSGAVRPWAYIGDQGRRAAVFGDETGSFEVWTWPLKLVRDLRLAFKVPEYDEAIPGATVARQVIARPEGLTIVYAHPSFTVRQHVFVPLREPGALMLLEVESVRPLEIIVRMHAEFNLAWPGSFGGSYITWDASQRRFLLSQGGVRLYNALIGSPFAVEGTAHAAHDAPTIPSQFTLRFDAREASAKYLPIAIAGGAAPRDSIDAVYRRLLANAPGYWREKVDQYRRVRLDLLTVDSPEPELDDALEWAKVNLDQQYVCNPDLGCGLVAGFGRAGAGNYRPGFGWFFGGDAAINSLAMDALGQFEQVRDGLQFMARYQREDGKIAHEISQSAARLPWFTDYPYTWFHGDTTPFWMLACYAYWTASADDTFLKQVWPNLVNAYRWSLATDTDGDGLMENPSAGAGAIEVGGLGESLWTDIYLAGVWVAALEGMQAMATASGDAALARDARGRYDRAQRALDDEFWDERAGRYVFALLQPRPDTSGPTRGARRTNDALTVWPATAMSFGLLDQGRADRMLREIGSSAITADWGARMLSRDHRLYDPLHYNNGTVWPFVTGFAALAHYRYHRGWAGHDLVRDVARATFDFARGRTPELLSGALYNVLDTAVPQQFFATSMLVTPLVRGMLGIEVDAPNRALALEPHLPAEWNGVAVSGVRVGRERVHFTIRREPGVYAVTLRRATPGQPVFVRFSPALPLGARILQIRIDDRDAPLQFDETAHDVHPVVEVQLASSMEIEIDYEGGMELMAAVDRLVIGDASSAPRLLDFRREARDYIVMLEGAPGSVHTFSVRGDTRIRSVLGGELVDQSEQRATVRVRVGAGDTSTVRREVRIRT